jgi:acyl-CoA synthetase (NDP forming)
VTDTETGLKVDRRVVVETDAAGILAGYGIAYPEYQLATSADEAVRAAEDIGYPIVLKVVSRDVVHKSDVAGVAVGINDVHEVRAAVARITSSVLKHLPGAIIAGYLVARQIPEGHDLIIGGIRDATFGASVMVGMGGIYAEVLDDVSFRVAPFDEAEAREMISELRAFPVLTGARGGEACDLGSLAEMLVAVSRLLTERPEIMELDLNPVRARVSGAIALDARMVVR